MARNIKRIAHDLIPLADATTELSTVISELLSAIEPHIQFDDGKAESYFQECIEASQKLAISATLVRKYISDVNHEADSQGIFKN